MAKHVKNTLIVTYVILLLHMVNTTPQVSFVRKCQEIDHTIYLKRSSVLNCPTEETVDFSGLNLSKIQPNLVRSLTIENVLLNRNKIQQIPEDVFKYVPNLKCVNLSWNKISYESLTSEHPNLKTLILDYETHYSHESYNMLMNNVWDLSEISSNFPNLEILSIRGNKITSVNIPFESFPRLSSLYLSDNDIQEIDPLIFKNHPELRRIHLEGNNIKAINLDDASNLEELYLDRNPIVKLIVDSYHGSLKVLSLSDCSLEETIYISSPLLITLDLSRNQINKIYDDEFQHTPLLENLNLMHNNVTFFPYLSYLKQLKRLFLGYNNISVLRHNSLPDSLKTLSLKGNRIEKFNEETFVNLEELEELDLSFNNLESLPIGWQDNLRMLRYLNLMSNRFIMIGDMRINPGLLSLKELCVANNFMGSVDLNSLQIVPEECTVYVLN